ncbi:MAG TPA: enoyl-CoA hydratase-related protein [Acidimicrobiales bacterium]
MSNDAVLYDIADRVATLTLNQPDNRNALTPALLDGLGASLESADADRFVRVIVLTNSGPAFCSGADLKGGGLASSKYDLPQILGTMQDSPKPVVGRIAGHCMGGGVGLAAACDISIVRSDIKFGFTEVRIGVAPAIISVVCLPKMRRSDALELFLTGERISAERAAEVGLINSVADPDTFDQAVDSLVRKLLAGGPGALAASKRLVFDIPGTDRATAFARTAEISRQLFASDEAAEGMTAFREKRPPHWPVR